MFKKHEETINVHGRHLSQDSTFDLVYFFPKVFPKLKLPNSVCDLSAGVAYMPLFMVILPVIILLLYKTKIIMIKLSFFPPHLHNPSDLRIKSPTNSH